MTLKRKQSYDQELYRVHTQFILHHLGFQLCKDDLFTACLLSIRGKNFRMYVGAAQSITYVIYKVSDLPPGWPLGIRCSPPKK